MGLQPTTILNSLVTLNSLAVLNSFTVQRLAFSKWTLLSKNFQFYQPLLKFIDFWSSTSRSIELLTFWNVSLFYKHSAGNSFRNNPNSAKLPRALVARPLKSKSRESTFSCPLRVFNHSWLFNLETRFTLDKSLSFFPKGRLSILHYPLLKRQFQNWSKPLSSKVLYSPLTRRLARLTSLKSVKLKVTPPLPAHKGVIRFQSMGNFLSTTSPQLDVEKSLSTVWFSRTVNYAAIRGLFSKDLLESIYSNVALQRRKFTMKNSTPLSWIKLKRGQQRALTLSCLPYSTPHHLKLPFLLKTIKNLNGPRLATVRLLKVKGKAIFKKKRSYSVLWSSFSQRLHYTKRWNNLTKWAQLPQEGRLITSFERQLCYFIMLRTCVNFMVADPRFSKKVLGRGDNYLTHLNQLLHHSLSLKGLGLLYHPRYPVASLEKELIGDFYNIGRLGLFGTKGQYPTLGKVNQGTSTVQWLTYKNWTDSLERFLVWNSFPLKSPFLTASPLKPAAKLSLYLPFQFGKRLYFQTTKVAQFKSPSEPETPLSPLILSSSGFMFLSNHSLGLPSTQSKVLNQFKANLKSFRYSFYSLLELKRLLLKPSLPYYTTLDSLTSRLLGDLSQSWTGENFFNDYIQYSKSTGVTDFVEYSFDNPRLATGFMTSFVESGITTNKEVLMKRIKFRPGYQRLWRQARAALNYSSGIKARYQIGLTRRLIRLRRLGSNQNLTFKDLTVLNILTSSRLVLDTSSSSLLIEGRTVFTNGVVTSNPNFQLFIGDFLQLIISLRYYILYKWLLYWRNRVEIKVRKLTNFKSNLSRQDLSKQVSYHLPDWIINKGARVLDIPKYLEVDYLTLSVYVLYEPLLNIDLSPATFLTSREALYSNYNWKFIT